MSVLSRVKRWFAGAPGSDGAEPASEPHLSRHERREAGRERHHRTGEPAWEAQDRVGQAGGFRKKLRGMLVVVVLVAIKAGQRLVKLRTFRVVPDPALQEIFSKLEIFALGFDAKRQAGLAGIIQRGGAGVPGHVPGRHVPEQHPAWLQRGDLPEKKQKAAPVRSLPGHVRPNEKDIRHQRTEAAQRRDKSELADLFPQPQVESNRAEMLVAMNRRYGVFGRQFRGAKQSQAEKDDEEPHHNSLR